MEREPEGRINWLEPDEEARLLSACVPMRQAVYDVLVNLPGTRQGHVWAEQSIRTAWENGSGAG